MKRANVHASFAVVALLCAVATSYEAARYVHAERLDGELTTIAAVSAPHRATAGIEPTAVGPNDAGIVRAEVRLAGGTGSEPRPIMLARAVALAAQGRFAAAGQRYESLLEAGPLDEIGRAALFDLGNAYLRQGAGTAADAARSLPMLAQAKARYRALLRVAPGDWDARYNLERALRLAPEGTGDADAATGATKHDVRLRGARSGDLP